MVDAALFLLAQTDGPNPIQPAPAEAVWGLVSIALLLIPFVIAVLVVRYSIGTRRIAERAAAEAASLRQEVDQRSGDPV